MKSVLIVMAVLSPEFSGATTTPSFQCESKYEGLALDLRLEEKVARATYTNSEGAKFQCESSTTILNQTKSQTPRFVVNLLFDRECSPTLSPDLKRTIARQMKISVPVNRREPAKIDWINRRTAQECVESAANPGSNFFKTR